MYALCGLCCFLPALFEGTNSRVNHWVFLKAACSAYFVLGSVAQVIGCRLRSSYSPLMCKIPAFPHTTSGQSQKRPSLLAAESTRLHKRLLHTRQESFHSQFWHLVDLDQGQAAEPTSLRFAAMAFGISSSRFEPLVLTALRQFQKLLFERSI